jgi:flagellar assembly protein FliH
MPRLGGALPAADTLALDAAFDGMESTDAAEVVGSVPSAPAAVTPGIDPELAAAREAEAYERGRSEAQLENARVEAVCAALEAAAGELVERADREASAWRELVLGLAMSIAQRWVGRELSTEPEAFMAMLGQALERLPEPRAACVRLAPEDLARLDAERPDWRASLAAGRVLEVEADVALGATEFRIEGAEGCVDGRVQTLLEDLETAFAESLDAPLPGEGGR